MVVMVTPSQDVRMGEKIMAVTKTTASDLVLEPTDAQFDKLVTAIRAHEGRTWTVGDILQQRIPRGIPQFTSRENGDETVSEHELFTRLSDALGGAVKTNTLKRWRNTAAAFRAKDRTEGISWAAHREGEALAWRDNGAHCANLVSWFRSEHRTVEETKAHVKAMMSHLDGTVIPPEGERGQADGETPSGHDLKAEPTDPKGKVEAFTAFTVSFREDPEAFAEFLPVIGRNWDIVGETLGAVPTDAELIEAN
jgi:hypothetical protein